MRFLLVLCLSAGLVFSSSLQAIEYYMPAIGDKVLPLLQKGHGYLVIAVDLEVDSAKIKISKRNSLVLTQDLTSQVGGFLVIPLRKGSYRIEELQVPYFNLPYIIDLESDLRWHFTIEPRKINYLGEITVKKLRTKRTVVYDIYNNTAKNMSRICTDKSKPCRRYPFRFAAMYRDDFLSELDVANEK